MFKCMLKFQKCSLGKKNFDLLDINQTRIRKLQKNCLDYNRDELGICLFFHVQHPFSVFRVIILQFLLGELYLSSPSDASFPTTNTSNITGSSKLYGPQSTDAHTKTWICYRTLFLLWAPLKAGSLLCHLVSGLKQCP